MKSKEITSEMNAVDEMYETLCAVWGVRDRDLPVVVGTLDESPFESARIELEAEVM